MKIRQSKEVPYFLEERMHQLVISLPTSSSDRETLLSKYLQFKGYQFLNPKSKFYEFFLEKLSMRFPTPQLKCDAREGASILSKQGQQSTLKSQSFFHQGKPNQLEEEVRVQMIGSISDISVGGMCEVVKDYMSQECPPYFPGPNQSFQQQFTYDRNQNLLEKVNKLFNETKLAVLGVKREHEQKQSEKKPVVESQEKQMSLKIQEFRKEMTVGEDGSLGYWGGKKYEGLGSRDEFSEYRREISQNYYLNTNKDRKK